MTAREEHRATRTDIGLCAVFALLVCSVYADPLFSGRTFGGRDLLAYNIPSEFAIHDAYARGRWPTWNAAVSGGRPLLANPNAGALYPIRPALARIPFSIAVKIFPVLHWALAGMGMLLLARALEVSPWGAWIGAVTFTFSGVSVSEVFFPHVQPGMTLLPWVCWAFIRPMHRGRRVALLSFLLGIDFLAGDVFTCGLAVACLLFWIALGTEPAAQKRALADLGAALLLAGCLAAPQILATTLWIPQTNRAVLGVKLGEALLYAVSPVRLLEFVIPYPFGATWALEPDLVWRKSVFGGRPIGLFTTFYCGAFALVSLAATRRSSERGVRFARAVLWTGLFVSVLPSLAPRGWASWRSPVALRNPEKLVVAVVFGLAILAAFGVDRLRRHRPRREWTLGVAVLLTLGALAASLLSTRSNGFGVSALGADRGFAGVALRQLPAALAEAGLAWVLTAVAVDLLGRGARGRLLAAMIILTAVLLGTDRRVARTFPESEAFPPSAFARMIERRDPAGDYRTVGESAYGGPSGLEKRYANVDFALAPERRNWAEHTQALWRRGTVFNDDFDAGDLARIAALRRLSIGMAHRGDVDVFRSASLRWGIRYRDQPSLPGYRRIGGDALQDWDELDGAYPDIRLLERWTEEGDVRRIPAEMSSLSPGQVVLETGQSRSGRARPGKVQILEKTPERLTLEAVCPDATFLFVLRDYWDYRTIFVDGRAVEAVPALIAFSAVPVPAGRHRIQWREQVPGGRVSRWGPVLFAAVCAWLVMPGRRRQPEVHA